MTQDDKLLLLKDLCARLPYGVICSSNEYRNLLLNSSHIDDIEKYAIKPYLRPMSSMTEEECKTLGSIPATLENNLIEILPNIPYYIEVAVPDQIDWLNAHHFDYRGLIEKGLALVAPEGMYNINEK